MNINEGFLLFLLFETKGELCPNTLFLVTLTVCCLSVCRGRSNSQGRRSIVPGPFSIKLKFNIWMVTWSVGKRICCVVNISELLKKIKLLVQTVVVAAIRNNINCCC